MWINDDVIYFQVKGVDMAINDEVRVAVAGLRNAGITVGRGHITDLEDFNKVQFYKTCLRTGYDFNHVVLMEEDMILMYCLMSKTKVNWINVIKEHILKIRKKPEYHKPYVVLISNFIGYFEVDVEEELVKPMKTHNEIIVATLNKISLKKINDYYWVCKVYGDGTDQQQDQEGEGARTSVVAAEGGIDSTQYAYMSSIPQ